MIRSWAELEDFIESGGRLRHVRRDSGDTWRTLPPSEQEVVPTLATRALAEGKLQRVETQDDDAVYAWRAA